MRIRNTKRFVIFILIICLMLAGTYFLIPLIELMDSAYPKFTISNAILSLIISATYFALFTRLIIALFYDKGNRKVTINWYAAIAFALFALRFLIPRLLQAIDIPFEMYFYLMLVSFLCIFRF